MAIQTWLSSSLVRHFPSTPAGGAQTLAVDVARNERFSFQLALHDDGRFGRGEKRDEPLNVAVSAAGPRNWRIRIRRVGYVPMLHQNTSRAEEESDLDGIGKIPGYVPDPLFDETAMMLPVDETHAFWFTVVPAPGARPGNYTLTVNFVPAKFRIAAAGAAPRKLAVRVTVHDVVIAKRKRFSVSHWFYNDALLDYYRCAGFDKTFWRILPAYLEDVVEHGQDMLYVPLFTPPLDGVKRPTQLLRIRQTGKGTYAFDWSDVRAYIRCAKRAGVRYFEWPHLFTQWGATYAPRLYHGQGADEKLLWKPETAATAPVYRRFLSQLLPALHRFMTTEGLLERSVFHLSDEPHGEHRTQYGRVREMVRELAPWMRLMDAVSDVEFAREKLTDLPVAIIETAPNFIKEGIPAWCYFCCGPRGRFLNRLLDTPLAKIRMSGWLFYRWPFLGFMHWGYNYWYQHKTRRLIDPFTVQMPFPGLPYGDAFLVYPGVAGPIDSIRWEIFAESLQDYALLQTLACDPESFRELKSFEDFPKSESWIRRTRRSLLVSGASKRKSRSTRQ